MSGNFSIARTSVLRSCNFDKKLPVENVFRNFKALYYHDLLKQLLNSYEQLIVQYECEGSFSS